MMLFAFILIFANFWTLLLAAPTSDAVKIRQGMFYDWV
jgi:hypothetical protein